MQTVTVDLASYRREAERIAAMEKRIAELEADAHAKLQAARGGEREVCARHVRQFIKSEKLTGKTAELVDRIARSVECPF